MDRCGQGAWCPTSYQHRRAITLGDRVRAAEAGLDVARLSFAWFLVSRGLLNEGGASPFEAEALPRVRPLWRTWDQYLAPLRRGVGGL